MFDFSEGEVFGINIQVFCVNCLTLLLRCGNPRPGIVSVGELRREPLHPLQSLFTRGGAGGRRDHTPAGLSPVDEERQMRLYVDLGVLKFTYNHIKTFIPGL